MNPVGVITVFILILFTPVIVMFLSNTGNVTEKEYRTEESKNKDFIKTAGKNHIKVLGIDKDLVSISVLDETVIINDGEIATIEADNKTITGTIKVIEIKEDSVILLVDLTRTLNYYKLTLISNIVISLMLTAALFVVLEVASNSGDTSSNRDEDEDKIRSERTVVNEQE